MSYLNSHFSFLKLSRCSIGTVRVGSVGGGNGTFHPQVGLLLWDSCYTDPEGRPLDFRLDHDKREPGKSRTETRCGYQHKGTCTSARSTMATMYCMRLWYLSVVLLQFFKAWDSLLEMHPPGSILQQRARSGVAGFSAVGFCAVAADAAHLNVVGDPQGGHPILFIQIHLERIDAVVHDFFR